MTTLKLRQAVKTKRIDNPEDKDIYHLITLNLGKVPPMNDLIQSCDNLEARKSTTHELSNTII